MTTADPRIDEHPLEDSLVRCRTAQDRLFVIREWEVLDGLKRVARELARRKESQA